MKPSGLGNGFLNSDADHDDDDDDDGGGGGGGGDGDAFCVSEMTVHVSRLALMKPRFHSKPHMLAIRVSVLRVIEGVTSFCTK